MSGERGYEQVLPLQMNSSQLLDDEVTSPPLPSLTDQEREALDSLDQSIRFHDSSEEEQDCVSLPGHGEGELTIVPHSFQPFKLAAIPETRESKPDLATTITTARDVIDTDPELRNKKINAGYILFDGSEIKYVTHKTGTLDSVRTSGSGGSDKASSIRSRCSTITQASEVPMNMSMSLDELLGYDYSKAQTRCSITPYRRLPTTAHFSCSEKMYFFFLGLASTITSNAIFMSVAYFRSILGGILGIQVLSILGSCHFVAALLAMFLVFCCKKHCFPFFPTVSVSLVLMAGVMAVFPSVAAVDGVTLPLYAIYGLVCLNGLCTGLTQAVIDKMVILFPGGKSSYLVRWGAGMGCVLPALIQAVMMLIKYREESESRLISHNTLCLYVVLPSAFVGTLLGLISVAKLRRCGIYGLFADIDSAKFSPMYTTIISSPRLSKKRVSKIAACMFAVFLVAAVSVYCLSLAPNVHSETLDTSRSSKAAFWKVYLTTVFLGLYRLGDFVGALLGALSRYCCKPLPRMLRTVLFVVIAKMRLGFVALTVLYIWRPFLVYHNVFTMGFYFVLALTNGFFTAGIVTHCQSICGVTRKDLCPIVSQITWLCIMFGCVVGAVVSFVPLL